jgi:CO/xanthine dehydrogenase FAD-binding subunit
VDLNTVAAVRPVRSRADLQALGQSSGSAAVLAGGSWLFSEPQDHLVDLFDLTAMSWTPVSVVDNTLSLAATCPLVEVSALSRTYDWPAAPLFHQTCTALFGSFKIWNVATIGGNICASLPAGPMTSLAAGLDAHALVWRADGRDELIPVAEFVTGNHTNQLLAGDVLRSIEFSADALASRTAYRKIALSPLGRSGAVLVGALSPAGAFLLTVTAATLRPVQLRFPGVPDAAELADAVDSIDCWFTDPHGAADWRHGVSRVLAEQIRRELSTDATGGK